METISSRKSTAVQRLRDIRDGLDTSLLFLEGTKLVEEALAAGLPLHGLYATSAFCEKNLKLISRLSIAGCEGTVLDDYVMEFVSDLDSPPGLIVLSDKPQHPVEDILARTLPLLVVLDALQLPNNVGAVARVAEAAGADALFQLRGGADPFSPKSLRASSGSVFRLPIFSNQDWPELHEKLAQADIKPVIADAKAKTSFAEWDWTQPTALVLGSEAHGSLVLKTSEKKMVTALRIPMQKSVESLNVSVAAGIFLYEAYRQRHKGKTKK